MALVRMGSRDAFEVLVRCHEGWVRSYMWGFGAGAEDVEDLVQEVFAKVYAACRRYHSGSSVHTWIRTIAKHVGIDFLRRRKRGGLGPRREEVEEESPDSRFEPSALVVSSLLSQRVRNAVEALEGDSRSIVMMRYFAGMPMADIASSLGCPVGTVKSRLHRALRVIRKRLEEYR